MPTGIALTAVIDAAPRPMCCRGCQAVAEAIVAGGLADYYRHRTEPPPTARDNVPEFLRQVAVYDNPAVQKTFVRHTGEQEREAALILEGIVCAACVWLNERHLLQLPGVLEVAVNYTTHRARVRWDNRRIALSAILKAVTDIGYRAHPYDPNRAQEVLERERRSLLRRLAVAGAFGMQIMVLAVALYAGDFTGMESEYRRLFHAISLVLCLPILGYSALPFFRNALRDLRRRHSGMDIPVTLGLALAFTGSVWATVTGQGEVYFDSVAMFVFFLLTGRYAEMAGRKRAADITEALLRLLPACATRIVNGVEAVVPAVTLNSGDRLRVRPGESIPADGTLLEGHSNVDESLLTGESLPLAKAPGATLIGGSLNMENAFVMRVDKTGDDTILSSMLRLLDRAQTEKPAIAASADRAAAWFVLRVLLLAAGVALFWYLYDAERWIPITVAVLVVTCPCALSLATPTAVAAATGQLLRRGLVTTRGHALETLARADTFVFDKTGTLTHGTMELVETRTFADLSSTQCLALAAALEAHSEHPIARALRDAGGSREVMGDIHNTPGAGLRGSQNGEHYFLGTAAFLRSHDIAVQEDRLRPLYAAGHTVVVLANRKELLAAFVLGDQVRDGARELINTLRQDGRRVLLLTGDHAQTAARIAQEVGIVEVEAGLRPEDKLARVRVLAAQGAVVAMVGDGINDAAALAAAHVSIAMGSGTQLAAASADMILLSGRLPNLAEAIPLARKTLRIIHQNMAWAVGYNLLAVPFAVAGLITPWMAAIGMSASSLLVVANALRLSRQPAGATLPRPTTPA